MKVNAKRKNAVMARHKLLIVHAGKKSFGAKLTFSIPFSGRRRCEAINLVGMNKQLRTVVAIN